MTMPKEKIEAFRRVVSAEFRGKLVDEICDLALLGLPREQPIRTWQERCLDYNLAVGEMLSRQQQEAAMQAEINELRAMYDARG